MTADEYRQPLRFGIWELTLRCNARCRLCGSSAKEPRPGELNREENLALARELVDLGLETITLSGGEPLLARDFFDLAEYFISAKVRTDVVTNGLLVDEDMARRLADLGLYGVTLSFDGPGPIPDALRGVPGCYRQLWRAADILRRYDVRVGAITHVNQTNLPHLDELAAELTHAGMLAWRLQLTLPPIDQPTARAEMLTPEQLPRLVEVIKQVQAAGKMKCYAAHDLGYYGRDELDIRRPGPLGPQVWKGCPAGLSGIGLLSDGGVLGCLAMIMHGTRFLEGNIRQRPLREMWRNPDAFAYNRRFSAERRTGTCRTCAFLTDCRCGCQNLLAVIGPDGGSNPLCLHALEKKRKKKNKAKDKAMPSIVVFTADGLRPDFLGCYGGEETPAIDALARDGLLVRHARGAAPWTVPAVASLMTGWAPYRLGLVKWRQRWDRAPLDLFSWSARRGYAVASFPFDRRHLFSAQPQARVRGLSWDLSGVENWLVGNHSRPSFTYIHWWGTHVPYLTKPLTLKNWQRSVKLLTDALDRHRAFAEKLRDMYRLAVRHLEQHVLPTVFRAVEKGRGWKDTIFVLTADHGESWCERYPSARPVRDVFDFHGRALYEENLRLPLILSGAIDRGEIAGPVTLMDLGRSLAELIDPAVPENAFMDGVNFLRDVPGDRPMFAVADRDFVDAKQVPAAPEDVYLLFAALRNGRKLIRHFVSGTTEWYDLNDDPEEKTNLTAAGHPPPQDLRQLLETEWARVVPVEWDAGEEKEITRRLKELGYI